MMCLRPKRIVGGLVLPGVAGVACASPSGLNNIPTADASPKEPLFHGHSEPLAGKRMMTSTWASKQGSIPVRWIWSLVRTPLFHRVMPDLSRQRAGAGDRPHIVFETWANLPDNGDDVSLALKLNFVFNF
jgi:hypothetical protein